MKTFIQVPLLIMAMLMTTSVTAQRAEPAVQPENRAPTEEQMPLERAIKRTQSPALIIELPPPEPSELSEPPQAPEQEQIMPHPAQIGIHRFLPEQWRGNLADYLADGSVEITSTGAQSIRVSLSVVLPGGGQIVFSGVEGHPVYTLAAHEISDDGVVWSPVVDDDTIRVELRDAGAGASVSIEKVSHIDPSLMPQPNLYCSYHINPQCRVGDFPDGQDDAIVRLIFEKPAGTFACSGTLMNNTGATFEPYILTSQHCINTDTIAASVSVTWFYQTQSCSSTEIDPRATTTHSGAVVLATSSSDDMTLLHLRDKPPAGVTFSGWEATALDLRRKKIGISS